MDKEIRKSGIKRIYDSVFKADKSWNDWYFDTVYDDDDVLCIEIDDKVASSLFLQNYAFLFHGTQVGLDYIAGAVTDYKMRHLGLMSQLICESLRRSFERGSAFCGLIPATKRLFAFYDKFGFATVVFTDAERYTALHKFTKHEGYVTLKPSWEAFSILENRRKCTVIHSERDFRNIMYDVAHDKGIAVQVNDPDGEPAAIAFSTRSENEIHVKELYGDSPEAIETALEAVKAFFAEELPMVVYKPHTGEPAVLRSRGMMRIVNVMTVLETIAAAHPSVRQLIKVHDPILTVNSGYYRLSQGRCERVERCTDKPTLEVNVDVLTKIVFSGPETGEIFGIPSSHPVMSLMLD